MTFKQILKLAEELKVEIETDCYWEDKVWYCDIDLPEGKSFNCQYHYTTFQLEDRDKQIRISKVRDEFAKYMKYEATEVTDCTCGFWDES